MEYSMVGITALIITLIICHSFIFTRKIKELSKATRAYRVFVFSLLVFFVADSCWGIFEEYKVMPVLYADTVIFFLAMGLSVFLWTRYVAIYIGGKGKTNLVMMAVGLAMIVFVSTMLIINIFNPILFEFTPDKEYNPNIGRYSLFIAQEVLYALTAIGALLEAFQPKRSINKPRFLVISLYSIAMSVAIVFQTLLPLLPMYSIGCMVGICLVNSFIVDYEKEESRKKLEEFLEREIKHQKELASTKSLVYNDSLTGAQSKFAYAMMEEEIDKLIATNLITEFAVVVFDINGLKYINDTLGHEAGDKYIKDCYKIITDVYGDNKVYRFGGDEFVVLLQDEAYIKKDTLLLSFNNIIEKNLLEGNPVVSTGMSEFDIDIDNTYRAVFVRADKKMYERKMFLKSRGSATR